MRRALSLFIFTAATCSAALAQSVVPISTLPTPSPGHPSATDTCVYVEGGTFAVGGITKKTLCGNLPSPPFPIITISALCNGATDDAPIINSAITAALATGPQPHLLLPKTISGVCIIGSPIILGTSSNAAVLDLNGDTIRRQTGAAMLTMISNGPLSVVWPFTGTYFPAVRTYMLPGLVETGGPTAGGSTPQVYDWTVPSNWYNVGASVVNGTIDGNGSDTSAGTTYGIMFNGASFHALRHLIVENIRGQSPTFGYAQSVSIWNGSYFTDDDITSINVYQGYSVQLAAFHFQASHLKTIGCEDSGSAVIGAQFTVGSTKYNAVPLDGQWTDIETDASITSYGNTCPNGFDIASPIQQKFDGITSRNVSLYGVSIHPNTGVAAGYLDFTNVHSYGSGISGMVVELPFVNITNATSTGSASSAFLVQGSNLNNSNGTGYVDEQLQSIHFVNPIGQGASGNYGMLVQSAAPYVNGTVKNVSVVGGNLGDPTSAESTGFAAVQTAGSVDQISVIGTTLRPSLTGNGLALGTGVTHVTYFPSGSDAASGDYAIMPTTSGYQVGTTNSNQSIASRIPNVSTATGSAKFTIVGTNSVSNCGTSGVAPVVVGVGDFGTSAYTGYALCVDAAGNLGMSGGGSFVGPVKVASTLYGASQTYLPPVWTNAGAPVASTVHYAIGSCNFSAATTCAASFTAPATFSSAQYPCSFGTPSTGSITFTATAETGTGFTIVASASNSDTVAYACGPFP